MNPQQLLLDCFDRAVQACRPADIMASFLPAPPVGRTVVVGAGKAAASMAAALEKLWTGPLEGMVVTRHGHGVECERIRVIKAGHLNPDEAGESAAREMRFCRNFWQ